jgi:hypothetical protein
VSVPTPLLDLFKRGEAPRDARLLAAQGALAPRAHEQLSLLILLVEDPDSEIRTAAADTLSRISDARLRAYLARPDVAVNVREFFAGRGILPSGTAAADDAPLIETGPGAPEVDKGGGDAREGVVQRVAKMTFTERMLAALKGSREMRAVLIRDPNKAVAASVLSSPRVNEAEIETFARMATVSEDILRMIGTNRAWIKNYGIVVGLTKNPKTPLALSLNLMGRLNDRDMSLLSIDRNIPEPLRIAARRKVVEATSKR